MKLRRPVCGSSFSMATVCILAISGVATGSNTLTSPRGALQKDSRQALLNQYCLLCHSEKLHTAGVVLEGLHPETPSLRPDIWEKVIRRLQAGEMPPAGLPRPDKDTLKAFRTGIADDLDAAAQKAPHAGRPVIVRLNRTQYANAIRDLLHLELPIAEELPPDGMAAGFDNIGDALSMSPLLLEQYLKVARKVSEVAVGVSDASPVTEIFPAPDGQMGWLGWGLPFGTRGGVRVSYYFPFDGEYNLRAFIGRDSLPHQEGVRLFQLRVNVKAGSHTVIVTFPDEFAQREGPVPNVAGKGGPALGGPLDTRGSAIHPTIEFRVDSRGVKRFDIGGISVGEAAFGGQPGPPTLDRVEISGPYNAHGATQTASQQRIFVCQPSGPHDEQACASKILFTVARRAFRRDVTQTDVEPFLTAWSTARRKRSFDSSIAVALRDVLLAPDFLFRLEFDPAGSRPGSTREVSDWELASRLSFFLWNSIPDDELLAVAHRGRLKNREVLTAQVQRMLDDSRSGAMIDNFTTEWLGLRALAEIKPDAKVYPDFDNGVRDDFSEETRLFVRSLIRDNRSILDLVGADYSYLNDRLARLYGVPGVLGSGFRRVSMTSAPERSGVLGQGSVLMLTSHTTKTSPILRGKWVLSALLNSPPPPPPAGVPPLDESPANGQKLTTRQQVERHRKSAVCSSCHSRMDPLGFSLENFDVMGRWRTHDDGGTIDPSGKLVDGQTFSGPQGLKQVLLSRQDQLVDATIARLLTYALGRELDAHDEPTVRAIMRESQPGGYRFGDVIVAITHSVPFRMKQIQEEVQTKEEGRKPS